MRQSSDNPTVDVSVMELMKELMPRCPKPRRNRWFQQIGIAKFRAPNHSGTFTGEEDWVFSLVEWYRMISFPLTWHDLFPCIRGWSRWDHTSSLELGWHHLPIAHWTMTWLTLVTPTVEGGYRKCSIYGWYTDIHTKHAGWGPRSIAFSCRTEKWLNSIGFMVDIYNELVHGAFFL